MRKLIDRYQALKSYRSSAHIVNDRGVADWTVYYQRTNRLRLEWKRRSVSGLSHSGTLVAKGKKLHVHYVTWHPPRLPTNLTDAFDGIEFDAGPSGTVSRLLVHDHQAVRRLAGMRDLAMLDAEVVDNQECYVITGDDGPVRPEGYLTFKLWISKNDFLLRRIQTRLIAPSEGYFYLETEEYRDIKVDGEISHDLFDRISTASAIEVGEPDDGLS